MIDFKLDADGIYKIKMKNKKEKHGKCVFLILGKILILFNWEMFINARTSVEELFLEIFY